MNSRIEYKNGIYTLYIRRSTSDNVPVYSFHDEEVVKLAQKQYEESIREHSRR